MAIFNRDYRRIAELHVQAGWMPATTRLDELEAAVRSVCEPYFTRPLSEISLAEVLVKLFQTETFADLDLVSVDTTRNDYLFAMIQNGTDYVRAKIAWDGMTEASERGTPAMTKTLENLRSALRSRIGEKAVLWVALSPNRIYADTQEPIQ
jgi:hypothetical protein